MDSLQSNNSVLHTSDKAKLRRNAPVIRKPVPTVIVASVAGESPDPEERDDFDKEIEQLNELHAQPLTVRRKPLALSGCEDKEGETSRITIYRVPTSSTFTSISPSSSPSRLNKPVVIPGVCIHAKVLEHPIGLPFIRAYAECLSAYNISEESFAAFIDELNLFNRGHTQTFKNVSRVGKVVHLAGHFDPTGITKAVGTGIQLTGQLSAWASVEGPLSRKKNYLGKANETLFNPRGVKAEVIGTAELRKRLKLSDGQPLTLPLNPDWVVPTAKELMAGQRCNPRAPHRIIHALVDHVQPIKLLREGNPMANPKAPEFSPDDKYFADAPLMDEKTRAQQISKNARDVRNIQVGTEIVLQTARREAVALLQQANAVTGTSKADIRRKFKLLKQAEEKDVEVRSTKKMKWLFIDSL